MPIHQSYAVGGKRTNLTGVRSPNPMILKGRSNLYSFKNPIHDLSLECFCIPFKCVVKPCINQFDAHVCSVFTISMHVTEI